VADADFSALKVLILDDIRAARQLLRAILATFNVKNVLEAEDGLSALELIKAFPRNLVITDYSMKPMDGLEFTRMLRAPGNSMNPFVHVLMISAHTEVALITNAIDAGVSDFMSKPITRATVEQRLKTAMRSQNDAKNIVLL
jgi:two-component system chemotaxis response regulator CheY